MSSRMRSHLKVLLWLLALVASPALCATDDAVRVELNVAENVQDRCRLSFVIENKSEAQIDSLRLDLAIFSREGIIQRRLVTEMGPLPHTKTMIKVFEIDLPCGQIGSILINDVAACMPGNPSQCLDRLAPSSRVQNIRIFK
jgi:hypothetical protein